VYVSKVRSTDVLLGRGPGIHGHPGNEAFRNRLQIQYLSIYASATKTQKTTLCQNIVTQCLLEGIGFLEKNTAGKWFHVSQHTARTKVAQTIHDIIKQSKKKKRSSSSGGGSSLRDYCTTTPSNHEVDHHPHRKPAAKATLDGEQQHSEVPSYFHSDSEHVDVDSNPDKYYATAAAAAAAAAPVGNLDQDLGFPGMLDNIPSGSSAVANVVGRPEVPLYAVEETSVVGDVGGVTGVLAAAAAARHDTTTDDSSRVANNTPPSSSEGVRSSSGRIQRPTAQLRLPDVRRTLQEQLLLFQQQRIEEEEEEEDDFDWGR
jgi:hypothetical protein